MILIDYSPIAIAAVTQQIGNQGVFPKGNDFPLPLVRHVVLNSLRANVNKFKKSSAGGEIILACDTKPYWRSEVFPFYKANRKTTQESSYIDWDALFGSLNKLKIEIAEFLPYKVLQVPGAEADDIIAILAKHREGRTLIISGDHDFVQLHAGDVVQWMPREKKFFKLDSVMGYFGYLNEHIIKGDSGDGIPNILSDDDAYTNPEKRCGTMSKQRLHHFLSTEFSKYSETEKRNWKRNEELIDLTRIPIKVEDAILENWQITKRASKSEFLDFLIANNMKYLVESISDF